MRLHGGSIARRRRQQQQAAAAAAAASAAATGAVSDLEVSGANSSVQLQPQGVKGEPGSPLTHGALLRIAVDVAAAMAYLHPAIVHR